ncbi:MAG: helix-turn-helix domain-containing protein [Deltaproteobacteria bacterium]|nr:helix-turn-helix domain-containing protein [Deltaproteobacteria bacterium]
MAVDSRISFEQFCRGLGFQRFPFSQYSTENELEIREKLFYMPSDYSPIVEAFTNGQSMFIVGNRGSGKTALLYDLESKVSAFTNLLITRLDDFSNLPHPLAIEQYYHTIIAKLTLSLFTRLVVEKDRIKQLNDEQRTLLVYLLQKYYPSVYRAELVKRIESLSLSWASRVTKRGYNFLRDLLNYGLSAAVQFTSDVVRQHFASLPPIPKEFVLRQYFPGIPLEANKDFKDQEVLYDFFNRCLELVKALGFQRFVIVLDKIDEDQRLSNDAETIRDFIAPVLTDNKLLLNERIQHVVSLWIIPFTLLTDRIRSQKLFNARLNWRSNDLVGALNKRMGVFSNGRAPTFDNLFASDVTVGQKQLILDLANRNPRDLWHIMRRLLEAQYEVDATSLVISEKAVKIGLDTFVKEFNYYEYYPPKIVSRADSLDVYSYIRHLLKLSTTEFTRNHFKDVTGISGGSASNYVDQMQRMGLIINSDRDGRNVVYSIVDPKIKYAIQNNISITKAS